MKTGHLKTDRFRGHFRELPRGTFHGAFRFLGCHCRPKSLHIKFKNVRNVNVYSYLFLQTRAPGRGVEIGKSPKVIRRWCRRSFGPMAQRSPKSLLHHVQPCFAPVQPQVAPVQETFRSLGSNDLLHPLLTTFGDFPFFDPSPRRSGLQTYSGLYFRLSESVPDQNGPKWSKRPFWPK